MVLFFDGGIGGHGGGVVAQFLLQIAENHVGAGAFAVGVQCFGNIGTGLLEVGFEQGGLRQLAVKLGDFEAVGLFVVAEQLGGVDGFGPVAVLLVDVQQHLAGLGGHITLLQAEENLLGAVYQAGALVVLPKLEQHLVALFAHGFGRFEQGLVQADGFVVFAALAVEFA